MIRRSRLYIHNMDMNIGPQQTIKSILGNDVNILNFHINPIITSNESQIIDVEYTVIEFNPMSIYYISNYKKINANSDIMITDLLEAIPKNDIMESIKNKDLINSMCKIPSVDNSEYKKYVPITINPNIQTTEMKQSVIECSYFGTIIKNPLHSFISIFNAQPLSYHGFEIDDVNILYKDVEDIKNGINIGSIRIEFKDLTSEIKIYSDLTKINLKNYNPVYLENLKFITSLNRQIEFVEELPKNYLDSGKSYLLNLYNYEHKLITNKQGCVLISETRNPRNILFIPNRNFIISENLSKSIKKFVMMDMINFKNFHYMLNIK